MRPGLRFFIILTIGLLFSSTFSAPGRTPEILVKIELSTPGQWQQLEHHPLRVCLRADSYVLATLSRAALEPLKNSDFSFQVIDADAWTNSYYLVTHSPHSNASTLKTMAEASPINDRETLVKMADERAFQLAEAGYQLSRIFDQSLPHLPPGSFYGRTLPQSTQNDLITQLNGQISEVSYRDYVQRLEDFKTRYTFSDSIFSARKWLFQELQKTGLDVKLDSFKLAQTVQYNVYATLPGKVKEKNVIIIGGHYDSTTRTNPRQVAPGADDNGSGTAGVLELARILASSPLDKTIIFIAFAGEEQGLWGSWDFAQKAYTSGMKIDLVLNMDMIATLLDTELDMNILTDTPSRPYAQLVAQLTNDYTQLIPRIGNSGGNSDHYPFQQYGYPALFFQEGDFSLVYHSENDLIDYLDMDYATEVLKSVVATTVIVANAPEAPADVTAVQVGDGNSQLVQWLPNDEPDLAGYKIYLGFASGNYTIVKNVVTAYDTLKNLAEGLPLYLTVTALDRDGNESMSAAEIVFTPNRLPATPTALQSTSRSSQIDLSWDRNNTELDLADYRITRIGPGAEEKYFTVDYSGREFIDTTALAHVLYQYTIQARDLDGNESTPAPWVRGQLATHDRGIFIIDATRDGDGQPLKPRDGDVDQFYQQILQDFPLAGEWDLADSIAAQNLVTDADLAIYSTVIVHSDVVSPSQKIVSHIEPLKKYLLNGGRILFSGWNILSSISANSDPARSFQPGEFVYDYLKIAYAETGPGAEKDFIGALSQVPGYPSVKTDPTKVTVFNGNLFAMEIFQPAVADENLEIVYRYQSSQNPSSARHEQPIALKYLDDSLRFVLMDFPLYFLVESEARQVVRQALTDLGENATGIRMPGGQTASTPQSFELAQSYPNPFRIQSETGTIRTGSHETTIDYFLPEYGQVTIRIYNLLGQVVKELVSQPKPAGAHSVRWDGRAASGEPVQSGIYFYEMRSRDFVQVRKMLLMH